MRTRESRKNKRLADFSFEVERDDERDEDGHSKEQLGRRLPNASKTYRNGFQRAKLKKGNLRQQ